MSHYLITGAAGGIGSAIARRLAGHRLTLVGRRAEALHALAADIPGSTVVIADLTTEVGAEALAAALAGLPPLDGAVHALGSLLLKPVHRLTLDEWRATMATNLDSAFLLVQLVARAQVAQPHPCSLVLFSSVAAGLGLANHEAIAAAKAGIEGLVRAAAATYAATGLRVNAVAPALTETPLTRGMIANEAVRRSITAMHPLGRLGGVEDQAAAACFLLGEEAAWITGQILPVDGGLRTVRAK